MRSIGTVKSLIEAERFCLYLKKEQIDAHSEPIFSKEENSLVYAIWVHDEDQIEKAAENLQEFLKDPKNPCFETPHVPPPPLKETKAPKKKAAHFFTKLIIALCALLYLLNGLQTYALQKEGLSGEALLLTPLQTLFLFDLPPNFEKIEQILQKYAPLQDSDALPLEIQKEIGEELNAPFWQGIYPLILKKVQKESTESLQGPLFFQIRQGEIWRLVTPCLLHGGLLHILFNMAWVWILSRPIEERIGVWKLLLLSLVLGVFANIVQYFVSGPFFLGYSGIVMGLAGFTWMREKIAPWEGYPMSHSTFLFLLLFIAGMFLLEFVSFILQGFFSIGFEPNIANSAHIAGALLGAFLGKLSFFSWRGS